MQGKSALNTITCVVFDGYSTNISELYATQQDAIHKVYGWGVGVTFLRRTRNFTVAYSAQTTSRSYLANYSMNNRGKATGMWSWQLTSN
jgi:hypothetical protein